MTQEGFMRQHSVTKTECPQHVCTGNKEERTRASILTGFLWGLELQGVLLFSLLLSYIFEIEPEKQNNTTYYR